MYPSGRTWAGSLLWRGMTYRLGVRLVVLPELRHWVRGRLRIVAYALQQVPARRPVMMVVVVDIDGRRP